jgi:hypothetical protein
MHCALQPLLEVAVAKAPYSTDLDSMGDSSSKEGIGESRNKEGIGGIETRESFFVASEDKAAWVFTKHLVLCSGPFECLIHQLAH